jgi:hypothetical protein
MKKLIYLAISLLLILSSAAILCLYYTQDFSENISFSRQVNMTYVKLVTSNDYISFTEAKIGELTLTNKGYFTEMYSFPNLVLCLGEGGVAKRFSLLFIDDDATYQAGQKLEIPLGGERSFNIYAGTGSDGNRYYEYTNYMKSDFPKNILGDAKIFLIPTKEENPISRSYDSNWQSEDCGYLTNTQKPFANLTIIS